MVVVEKAKTQAKGITLLKTLSNMFHLFKRHDVVGKHENSNNFTEFTEKILALPLYDRGDVDCYHWLLQVVGKQSYSLTT